MTIIKQKRVAMKRINTRLPDEQHKFIKELAAKLGKSEGETTRIIIKYYMGQIK